MVIKRKIKIVDLLNIILCILLVISCDSVYYITNREIIYALTWIHLGICIIYKIASNGVFKQILILKYPIILYISLLAIASFLLCTVNIVYLCDYCITIPLLLVYFLTFSNEEKKEFLVTMGNVIFVLAVLSMITWLLGPIYRVIKPSNMISIVWGNETEYYGYCYITYERRQIHLKRYFGFAIQANTSFFIEAPLTNVIYTLGYVLNAFVREKKSMVRELFLLASIITTWSMTGIILALGLFAFRRMISSREMKITNARLRLVIRVIIPSFVLLIILIGTVFLLSIKLSTDSGNYNAHFGDLKDGFLAFIERPILGNRFDTEEDFGNTTSGLFKVLTNGGILVGMIYCMPFVSYLIKFRKDIRMLTFAGVSFLLLVLVVYQYTPFCMFILALGMSYFGFVNDRTPAVQTG